MYVAVAFAMIIGVGWYSMRDNAEERGRTVTLTDDEIRAVVLFARQDIRVVALILAAILVMLGIIAERIH